MLEEILSVPAGSLRDSDTRETVDEWSSLVDVQIMTVIGSELALDEDPELISFDSVGELLAELEQRGAFTS
ncbi:MAG: hypothetical protein ACJ786_38360 [Catenulispora sp.]